MNLGSSSFLSYDVVGTPEGIGVIHADKAASIRVAEKLGAGFERHINLDGQPVLI